MCEAREVREVVRENRAFFGVSRREAVRLAVRFREFCVSLSSQHRSDTRPQRRWWPFGVVGYALRVKVSANRQVRARANALTD